MESNWRAIKCNRMQNANSSKSSSKMHNDVDVNVQA